MSNDILCVGEILWDALPKGLFLGGAPFNVACHLHALGQEAAFASRVGDDRLGYEAIRRVQARGLEPALIQTDDSLPTGFVQVEFGNSGEPDYDILEPAAWDALTLTDALQQHVEQASALVYGTLAQRTRPSRQTIQRLCQADVWCVLDLNLRPPFVDRTIVEHSLERADVVKCNDDELHHLQTWLDLPGERETAMSALAETFDNTTLCVTQGSEGAWLWQEGSIWHHSGYPVEAVDPVGAGDAFLAAFLAALLAGRSGNTLLDPANRLGAFVASRRGALPAYEVEGLDETEKLTPGGHSDVEAEQ